MPTPGLSLVGFMVDQAQAVQYLERKCIFNEPRTSLARRWLDARGQLGKAVPGFGSPDIKDLPPACDGYLKLVEQNPRFRGTVGPLAHSFKLVEIDQLLAFQWDIETEHSAGICETLPEAPGADEMLQRCLPHSVKQIAAKKTDIKDGVILTADDRNFRMIDAGYFGEDANIVAHFAGILAGESSPLVQVVKFAGRYYLKNGFHRAYGLRKRNATHMPCLILEATNYAMVDPNSGKGTFARNLMESGNPPTMRHFTQGLAYNVQLRKLIPTWKVTWENCTRLE